MRRDDTRDRSRGEAAAAADAQAEARVPICADPDAAEVAADDDAAIVRDVLAGDVEAFERIVERWKGPLFRLALRYTIERGAAEDLCQEVFLHVFRGLRRWRGESRFSTWLIAVATNVCRSHARRAPPPEPVEISGALEPEAPEADDPSRHEHVRRAVNALPAHYRDALHLFYFHGADVAAAAASLGVPQGTLKARLARGRRLLKPMLDDPFGGRGGDPRS